MKKKKLLSVLVAAALSCSLFTAAPLVSYAKTTDDLLGKPWVTSILQGNLPEERPDVKDDLYAHYNYDFLAAHQEQPGSVSDSFAGEMKASILNVLSDSSKTGHDLEQMRIFFNQALDTEALKEAGLSQVQPYLERIEAVTSIEEMNRLLTASDFPFSPFLVTTVSLKDTREANIVTVNPNLLFVDPLMVGGQYYQDSEDPAEQETIDRTLYSQASNSLLDLAAQGMPTEEIHAAYSRMLAFEKPHAKYLDYNGKFSGAEFGAWAQFVKNGYITLDELCDACSNFPMKALLEKLGMGNSEVYSVSEGWPEAFNELWTEENLEVIKEIAKLKILNETRPYRDQTAINEIYQRASQQAPDTGTFAFNACDSFDTFVTTLSETYVKECIGTKAIDRLTRLTEDIIDTYKDLVKETSWIGEESRNRILEKLDHMTISMLEPSDGYYDLSGLELVPTEEGGTLFDNYLKLKAYHQEQKSKMLDKSTTPVISWSWYAFKPTIMNAYYDSVSNSINIIPGYINSLEYTDDMSETELLAGLGFVIGHEISHGFDYAGSQFDAYGRPEPVFADEDVDEFVQKTSALANYYKSIEVAPGVMVNGGNVVTEAAADLSGLQAVLEIAGESDEIGYEDLFESLAGQWAQVIPETTMYAYLLDPHPLDYLRMNVSSQMFDPIYETYDVEEGDGMYLAPEERINIWGRSAAEPETTNLTIYRLYNPNDGGHLFTWNSEERDILVTYGWSSEGTAWKAPEASNAPVYRVYNPNSGEHHYTMNVGEKDILVSLGWKNEGIGWYSDDSQGTPLYRLYNPNAAGQYEAGGHHYTKDVNEKNSLIAAGWRDEGIGWYGI